MIRILPFSLIVAGPTIPSRARSNDIRWREFVAVFTVRFTGVHGGKADTSQRIFSIGDRFKM